MKYVQSKDGVFIRHIFDVEPTQWDENNYCYARKLDPERAALLGVSKLQVVTPPYYNPATQCRIECDAVLVDGVWTQVYAVEELTEQEKAAAYAEAATRIRAERDRYLAKTDWWVSKATEVGGILPTNQQTYRQQLRDVTAQAGFPWDVQWPEPPVI